MLKNSQKYVKKIDASSVYDVVIRSPITLAENLSLSFRNKIFLKREDLQPTHSFKMMYKLALRWIPNHSISCKLQDQFIQ